MVKAVASWSGGKDSALALHEAIAKRIPVIGLVNIVSADTQRVAFQGIPPQLIKLQAEALGLQLFQEDYHSTEVPACCQAQSSRTFSRLYAEEGIRLLVSGHISDTDVQNQQLISLCQKIGLSLHAPLAGKSPKNVITEFFKLGLKAVIVKVDTSKIEEHWLGKPLDENFINYVRRKSLNLCGDLGEYHTLVIDGPLFRKTIKFSAKSAIKEGRNRLLDIRDWRLSNKRHAK